MKRHYRVVVVGGGAVGVGIAYHLAKAGWKEIALLERDELTSGSTWHAAGLLPLFNMSYATSHIHDYSVKYYKELQNETGLDPGFSIVGNLGWPKLETEWMSICFMLRQRRRLEYRIMNG